MDSKNNTEEKFDESEVVAALNEFLETLNRDKRYIFVRRYWYFDSIQNISKQCSMSEENIRVILSRVRSQLKDYLKKRGGV